MQHSEPMSPAYRYVDNNPQTYRDPYGLKKEDSLAKWCVEKIGLPLTLIGAAAYCCKEVSQNVFCRICRIRERCIERNRWWCTEYCETEEGQNWYGPSSASACVLNCVLDQNKGCPPAYYCWLCFGMGPEEK